MASWREGGRPAAVLEDTADERTQPDNISTSMSVSAASDVQKHYMMGGSLQYPPYHGPLPPYMAMRPGIKPPGPVPFHMAHMPMMPPNYNPMMMSPFGFRSPMMPPNYRPGMFHPGMPRPPFMPPAEMRMRGGSGHISAQRQSVMEDDASQRRPAIVKKGELDDMDRLGNASDCWASSVADVDYSQRLVFSDEEDFAEKSASSSAVHRQSSDGGVVCRNTTVAFDHDSSSHKSEAQDPLRPTRSVSSVSVDSHDDSQKQQAGPSHEQSEQDKSHDGKDADGDNDDEWHRLCRQQAKSMSAAVERARKRREEDERRLQEEQRAGAQEKLRQLEEKFGKKPSKSSLMKASNDDSFSSCGRSDGSDFGSVSSSLNYHQKKNKSFGGSSLDMPSEHREGTSPPQTIPDYRRSESLPATPSDATRPSQPPLQPSLQYRYAGPGYWPVSYDMRMWAGLQMQQYMMDQQRHASHGSGQPSNTDTDSSVNDAESHEASPYMYKWPWMDQRAYSMSGSGIEGYHCLAPYYGYLPEYDMGSRESLRSSGSQAALSKLGGNNTATADSQGGQNQLSRWSSNAESLSLSDTQEPATSKHVARNTEVEKPTIDAVDKSTVPGKDAELDVVRSEPLEPVESTSIDEERDQSLETSFKHLWSDYSVDWKDTRRFTPEGSAASHRKLWKPNDDRPTCPPPITAERARQNVPSASSYMSLKHSRTQRESNNPRGSDTVEQDSTAMSTLTGSSSTRSVSRRSAYDDDIWSRDGQRKKKEESDAGVADKLSKLSVKDSAAAHEADGGNQSDHPPRKKTKSSSRSRRRRKGRTADTDAAAMALNGGVTCEFVRGGGGRVHNPTGPRRDWFAVDTGIKHNPSSSDPHAERHGTSSYSRNTADPALSRNSDSVNRKKTASTVHSAESSSKLDNKSGSAATSQGKEPKSRRSTKHYDASQLSDGKKISLSGSKELPGDKRPIGSQKSLSSSEREGNKPKTLVESESSSQKGQQLVQSGSRSAQSRRRGRRSANNRPVMSTTETKNEKKPDPAVVQSGSSVQEMSSNNAVKELTVRPSSAVDHRPTVSTSPSKQLSPADVSGANEEWETASEGSDGGIHARRQATHASKYSLGMSSAEPAKPNADGSIHHSPCASGVPSLVTDVDHSWKDVTSLYQFHASDVGSCSTQRDLLATSSTNTDSADVTSPNLAPGSRLFAVSFSDPGSKQSLIHDAVTSCRQMSLEQTTMSEGSSNNAGECVWPTLLSEMRGEDVATDAEGTIHRLGSETSDSHRLNDSGIELISSASSSSASDSWLAQMRSDVLNGCYWTAEGQSHTITAPHTVASWWSNMSTSLSPMVTNGLTDSMTQNQSSSSSTVTLADSVSESTNASSGAIGSHRLPARSSARHVDTADVKSSSDQPLLPVGDETVMVVSGSSRLEDITDDSTEHGYSHGCGTGELSHSVNNRC